MSDSRALLPHPRSAEPPVHEACVHEAAHAVVERAFGREVGPSGCAGRRAGSKPLRYRSRRRPPAAGRRVLGKPVLGRRR